MFIFVFLQFVANFPFYTQTPSEAISSFQPEVCCKTKPECNTQDKQIQCIYNRSAQTSDLRNLSEIRTELMQDNLG